MKKEMIIRAWKDPSFRASLSDEERATIPESPSGRALTELDEGELNAIVGGKAVDLQPSTGCTGPVRATCGIVLCSPAE
ncbi:mersacidin/lichenicidin family type 2 lantibiotic [Vitiosangium sp. GDMCC 1.1324]|uniref:mersacidin/lichenicidin family type 2 lantibiotic n=1 Tax=Vitiosangium sp. (strain GDMCC 1.1324) TaxID=2138576 RepID=UPI000D36D65D|nr:mersacidin/lichenicidin family type 2 lantibiotic [Vitiosangium sp. GDMCC 1.1324]PTL76298.1 mersacidin/lichenicidin family type 2 lantibiotic [Vitiosangium sp. GDMCC 1.1324]